MTMSTKLDLQISELRATAKAASSNPMLPAAARVAINQLCLVIEQLALELGSLRETLASHCHLRSAT